MTNKLMILSLGEIALLGLPVEIINPKYKRGSYEFNFGIMLPSSQLDRLSIRMTAEQLLRKMAYYLKNIELEHEALSKKNPEFNIGKFTEQLFERLTSGAKPDEFGNVKFSIELFPTTFFHFNAMMKSKKRFQTPPVIQDLDVPVFIDLGKTSNLEVLLFGKEQDLLLDRILPCIDSYRHVMAIAIESKVDCEIVKMVL